MTKKDIRFQLFDFIVALILIGVITSLLLFPQDHFIISVQLIGIALWMFLILAGRFVAPLYLEGRIIRTLLKNGGDLPAIYLEKVFRQYSAYDEHLKRLVQRNAIEFADNLILINADNYTKGLRNRIMMWGTRKL